MVIRVLVSGYGSSAANARYSGFGGMVAILDRRDGKYIMYVKNRMFGSRVKTISEDTHVDTKRERELLEGLLLGEEPEMRLFFEVYGGIIKKAVDSVGIKDRSLTGNDLFMAAVEHLLRDNMKILRSFRGKSKLSTYIYTICFRHAIELAARGIPPGPDPDTLHAPESVIEEVVGEKEKQAFEKAVLLCKPKERVFIRMMFYDECSTAEILTFFGWKSENTVYSQKNKIINKLKKITRSGCQYPG